MNDSQNDSQHFLDSTPTRPDEADMITPPCDCKRCQDHDSVADVYHSHHARLDNIEQRMAIAEKAIAEDRIEEGRKILDRMDNRMFSVEKKVGWLKFMVNALIGK